MSPTARPLKSGSRTTITLLSLAVITAAVFWVAAAVPYLTARRDAFGRYPDLFWDRRYGLWLHILGGTTAMFTGPVQIWLGETRQKLPLHRLLGSVYLLGVSVTCLAAYYLSLTTPVGFIYASGLFGMALACTIATSMAYLAIRRRNFVQHREWMIRSYVVILSFVFFRMIVVALEGLGTGGAGTPGNIARASFASWSSWAILLLLTELFLQLPKLGGDGRASRAG